MGGGSSQQSQSTPQFQQFPGLNLAGDLAGQISGFANQDPLATRFNVPQFNIPGAPQSEFFDPFKSAVINPDFSQTSPAQNALIDQAISRTQGNRAVRGLDPTQSSNVAAVAPLLAQFQQQRQQNLGQAFQADIGQQLQTRGQDIDAALGRGQQEIGAEQIFSEATTGRRGQSLSALLELAGLSLPQVVGGNQTTESGSSKRLL